MTKLLPLVFVFASISAQAAEQAQYCDNAAVQADAQNFVRSVLKDGSAQVDPVDASAADGGECLWIPITIHSNGKTKQAKALICETCAVTSLDLN